MSGGAFDYLYCRVEDVVGRMGDREVDSLIHDVAELLRSREWCLSDDTSEESYAKDLQAFRSKWLAGSEAVAKRHTEMVETACDQLKAELLKIVNNK